MAGLNEPKKETVRIDLPLPTAGKALEQNRKETVRSQLPLREPMGKAPPDAPTELQSAAESSAQDLASSEFSPPASVSSGPKKETVRISPVPDPAPSTGQIENTQSVIAMPEFAPENASTALASPEKSTMLLYWILLGVSALILIIQIWTYFS